MGNEIVLGDNLAYLAAVPADSINLIYIDPPFNTGKRQTRRSIKVTRDGENGDRVGFGGHRYRTSAVGGYEYPDAYADYRRFMLPRFEEARRTLKPDGSLFVHLDWREVHYCRVWLDDVFGRDSFMNEIIWTYDFGARSRKRWPTKHDTILWYAMSPERYTFNIEDVDRIPYLAPGLVGPEKAARGKTPTDTWWQTIVSPTGKEKTGYPTQKPVAITNRIVKVHSNPGDLCVDFFAGSGTFGESAARLDRKFVMVDSSPDAVAVMNERLAFATPTVTELKTAPDLAPEPPARRGAKGKVALSADLESQRRRVTILTVAVSKYDDPALPDLRGPAKDLGSMKELLSDSSGLGLYDAAHFTALLDPTVEEMRTALVDYARGRSARGDVLILYFSGHGCVVGPNEFGFCLKDSRCGTGDNGVMPLSVLKSNDVVSTLAMADVHPVFIVDACFSGAMAGGDAPTPGLMHDDLARYSGSSYGLLCSSNQFSPSDDTADGGPFTQALLGVGRAGLGGARFKRRPFLTLGDLNGPIQAQMEREGRPLSRLHLGPDLPEIPLLRNTQYEARQETVSGYLRDLVKYLWHGGKPRQLLVSMIASKVSNGAYGNHSKLSLKPWDLVESVGSPRARQLTARGRRFAQGRLRIPRVLQEDPVTGDWAAAPKTKRVLISEI